MTGVDAREARLVRSVLAAALLLAGVSGCAPEGAAALVQPSPATARTLLRELAAPTVTLPSQDPAELALTASQLVFERSPLVVLAASSDAAAAPALSPVAEALHAPVLLVDGPGDRALAAEAERLGASTAVVVEEERSAVAAGAGGPGFGSATGSPSAVPGDAGSGEPTDAPSRAGSDVQAAALEAGLDVVLVDPADVGSAPAGAAASATSGLDPRALEHLRADLGSAFPTTAPALLSEVLALVQPAPGHEAALATLRAAGAVAVPDPAADPGADAATVRLLADAHALTVVGVGPGYSDAPTFAWQVAAAGTGTLLPTGTQRLGGATFDGVRTRLGRSLPDPAAAEPGAVPTVVLRAAVRQTSAGADGDYLRAKPLDELAAVVDTATAAGQYVVLELEGGRVALADQVRAVAPLLERGGVGVLLHPEQRRSGAGQDRGREVMLRELQAAVDELAGIVTGASLPQALLAVESLDDAVDGVEGLAARPQVAVVDADVLGLER